MKKFLNGLGIFGSVILSICLAILIFIYVAILNVKSVVSEKGFTKILKNIDVVDVLKYIDDGTIYEYFIELGDKLNLTENEFEDILNSDKVKEVLGGFLVKGVSSTASDKKVNVTKEDVEGFLNITIEEYNKINNTKIPDYKIKEIVGSFNEEIVNNLNESINKININENIDSKYINYVEFANKVLFGNYTTIMLILVIGIVALIALFRFSYYKWIPYVVNSIRIPAILMLLIGLFLCMMPLNRIVTYQIIFMIKDLVINNIIITSIILFTIVFLLNSGYKEILKRFVKNEEKLNEKVNDKKDDNYEEVK